LEIVGVGDYDTSPEQLGLPSGAAVVSANRFIGFGQSATQEEVHVGSSPEACPAVLLTPPLGDDQVLVVKGAEAMVNIVGQRRNIHVEPFPETDKPTDRSSRTMLFMDALEIDMQPDEDGLPDLKPANLDREIRKATLAFSSSQYGTVNCPLWGCGSFGGDPYVKVVALWCAASMSNIKLRILCDDTQLEIASNLRKLVIQHDSKHNVRSMRELLGRLPQNLKRFETFQWIQEN
jgi:poly(ADP-ribose) glycohydrolase